jgi:hypothetical protein
MIKFIQSLKAIFFLNEENIDSEKGNKNNIVEIPISKNKWLYPEDEVVNIFPKSSKEIVRLEVKNDKFSNLTQNKKY